MNAPSSRVARRVHRTRRSAGGLAVAVTAGLLVAIVPVSIPGAPVRPAAADDAGCPTQLDDDGCLFLGGGDAIQTFTVAEGARHVVFDVHGGASAESGHAGHVVAEFAMPAGSVFHVLAGGDGSIPSTHGFGGGAGGTFTTGGEASLVWWNLSGFGDQLEIVAGGAGGNGGIGDEPNDGQGGDGGVMSAGDPREVVGFGKDGTEGGRSGDHLGDGYGGGPGRGGTSASGGAGGAGGADADFGITVGDGGDGHAGGGGSNGGTGVGGAGGAAASRNNPNNGTNRSYYQQFGGGGGGGYTGGGGGGGGGGQEVLNGGTGFGGGGGGGSSFVGDDAVDWPPNGTTVDGDENMVEAYPIFDAPDQEVAALSDVSMTVRAPSSWPVQWYVKTASDTTSHAIAGATSHTLSLLTVRRSNAGQYEARVATPWGFPVHSFTNLVVDTLATTLQMTGTRTGDFHDPFAAAALLTTGTDTVLSDKTVSFTLNGNPGCTGPTSQSGTASCSIEPHETPGVVPLAASFAGDDTYSAATASVDFTETKEEAVLAYTGATVGENGKPLHLSVSYLEGNGRPMPDLRFLTFEVGSGSTQQVCGAFSVGGAAECTITTLDQPASALSVPIHVVDGGDFFSTFYEQASTTALVSLQFMTGRAFGAASTGLIPLAATPDTGLISAGGATTTSRCAAGVPGNPLVTAGAPCVGVTTRANPGSSTAEAELASISVGSVTAKLVRATSQSSCAGSSGSATVADLRVGTTTITPTDQPAPNTVVHQGPITVVLNEQIPTDHGLTVNAVHVVIAGVEDIVIASATSGIHGCAVAGPTT